MRLTDWTRRVPWPLVALVVALMLLGWLALARCSDFSGGNRRWVVQQMIWSALAVAAMLLVTVGGYRGLCRWAYLIFGLSLAGLVAVYFFSPVNGAHRWIRVGALGFQPSEFAKVALVLALARYLMYRENYRRLPGLIPPLVLTLIPALLVLKEPDLGTAIVFLPVLLVMLFVAGARRIDLVCCALAGVLLLPVLWGQMSREQKSRVTALLEQTGPGQKPIDDTYQLHQAKQMLALGGWCGSALGGQAVDDSAVYTLPEARTDFILCVLGERFGLWGVGLLLGLFGVLLWRGLVIAQDTHEPFGRLLAAGVCTLLGVQVAVNTGMATGLLPVVGISLPLVSYGGSGLLAQAVAIGLLLNVGMRPGYEMTREPFKYAVAE